MKIEVESNIAEGIREKFDEVRARGKDVLPYYQVKAQELDTLIQADVFLESTSPFGDKWKPLKAATTSKRRKGKGSDDAIVKKQRKPRGNKPLIDTGILRAGVFAKGHEKWVEFGVSGAGAVYAAAHQFGVKTKKNNMDRPPARPFLPAAIKNGVRQADFSRGPAKVWYDGLRDGLKKWLISGDVNG